MEPFISRSLAIPNTLQYHEVIEGLKKECSVYNPLYVFFKAKKKYTGNIAKKIDYYSTRDDKDGQRWYLFPRQLGDRFPEATVYFTAGKPGYAKKVPKFSLWPEQQTAVDTFVERIRKNKSGTGLLQGPCGSGKTIMGAHVINELAVRALILVDQNILGDQWLIAFEDYLGMVPGEYVFRDKTKRCAKAMKTSFIDVCTVQSLMPGRSPMTDEEMAKYGFVYVDECHIVPAEIVSKVVSRFRSCYVGGTTATPHRKDGRSDLIRFFVGDIHAKVNIKQLDPVVKIVKIPQLIPDAKLILSGLDEKMERSSVWEHCKSLITPHPDSQRLLRSVRTFLSRTVSWDSSTLLVFSEFLKQQLLLCSWWSSTNKEGESIDGTIDVLCKSELRNTKIVENVVKDIEGSRHVMVLSPFKYHCETLQRMLAEKGVETKILNGDVKRADRMALIKDFKEEKFRCILATFALVKKGLDVPILDTLHLTHPFKIISAEEAGDLEQACGRVRRRKLIPLEPAALIYDYMDTGGGPEMLTWKHWRYYKAQDWRIEWDNSLCSVQT